MEFKWIIINELKKSSIVANDEYTLFHARDKDTESKEEFNARLDKFIPQFLPLMIKLKEEYLERHRNNPRAKQYIKKWEKALKKA